MNTLKGAVNSVVRAQRRSRKPLAVMLAGHNGSGKSTMWYGSLAQRLKIPLINADRMMMSILPPTADGTRLPAWARAIRDKDENWMRVAQKGVESFVALAAMQHVPFAIETVFSHWQRKPDGTYASKIDKIRELQSAHYFVLLLFVGLSSVDLSIGRVETRVREGGHGVATKKLRERFARTQRAISVAAPFADAAILMDNSRSEAKAFTICRVQLGRKVLYDCRDKARAPREVLAWLNVVSPR